MGNSKKLPLVFNIRNDGNDRVMERHDLKNETMGDILFIDNLDQEHLKPFIDLLVEHTEGLSYEKGFDFFRELIRNQLNGPSDLCHINTNNWNVRLGWPSQRQKYNPQINEAVEAMTP